MVPNDCHTLNVKGQCYGNTVTVALHSEDAHGELCTMRRARHLRVKMVMNSRYVQL